MNLPQSLIPASSQIFFLRVENNETKCNRICATAKLHFNQRERVLITVQDDVAATFLDEILWKNPPESFLPHIIANRSVSEPIVITTQSKNHNNAKILINLSPNCSPILNLFEIIYELWDLTSPAKKLASQDRFEIYQKAGHNPSII